MLLSEYLYIPSVSMSELFSKASTVSRERSGNLLCYLCLPSRLEGSGHLSTDLGEHYLGFIPPVEVTPALLVLPQHLPAFHYHHVFAPRCHGVDPPRRMSSGFLLWSFPFFPGNKLLRP